MVGAGLDYGKVEVLITGDTTFRKELDIDGEVIVRATRLEAYSKLLISKFDGTSSYLVINSKLIKDPIKFPNLKTMLTNVPDLAIRDYPEIHSIYFRQWKHRRVRDEAIRQNVG